MQRRSFLAVLANFVILSYCGTALSDAVPAVFDIDPALSDVSISIAALGDSDSSSSTLSGTIESSLTIDPSGGTPLITGMEFTGGRYFVDDSMDWDLTVLIFFNFNITSDNVSGFADTPAPPAPVTSLGTGDLNYEFDSSFHEFTFDQGILEVTGATEQSIDLSTDPQSGSPPEGILGTINLVQGQTSGNLTDFSAVVNVPIEVNDSVDIDTGLIGIITVDFEIVGQIVATADFAVDIGLGDIPGDLNGDGIVDGIDFLIWQVAFGINDEGDADGDGDTDGDDFLIWQLNFGNGSGTGAGAVPEPATAALALLLLGLVMLRPR